MFRLVMTTQLQTINFSFLFSALTRKSTRVNRVEWPRVAKRRTVELKRPRPFRHCVGKPDGDRWQVAPNSEQKHSTFEMNDIAEDSWDMVDDVRPAAAGSNAPAESESDDDALVFVVAAEAPGVADAETTAIDDAGERKAFRLSHRIPQETRG